MAPRTLSGVQRGDVGAFIDIKPIALVVGIVLIILAMFMIPPMMVDLVIGHPDWQVFFLAMSCTAFVGISLVLMHRKSSVTELTIRQGFLLTTMVWLVTTVFAALPLAFSELGLTAADAFFEAMSGITTTGSTVIIGLDYAQPGILLWRSILQWLGGIGIIVMGVAILPMLRIGGMQLFRTESSDLSDKILPRAAQIASAIGSIYLLLSFACGFSYLLAGMDPFNAVTHAMTTIATGGYSTSDSSIGFFNSARIEWTAILFMFLGGIPFVLYIQALRGNARPLRRDVQVRWFVAIILMAALVLIVWLRITDQFGWHEAVRHTLFTVVSVVTGTGYASTDWNAWGPFAIGTIFFLMCIGGCTGSTTGGIKVFRFAVLYAVARVQIQRLLQPNGVFRARYNGQPVTDTTVISILTFVFFFALSFSILAMLLSAIGLDYLTAMSASITALANVGPGLGPEIGPAHNFGDLPEAAKWLLSFGMLLGRLELLTVLVLFAPGFWRA